MSSGGIVVFNDPRRFGVMDLVRRGQLAQHPALSRLGPEPLSEDFTPFALARACVRRTIALKVALLDQRVVAGLGNIYASEALHRAQLAPQRMAATIATPTGRPRPSAYRLTKSIKEVLTSAIDRLSTGSYDAAGFHVYDRAGAPCHVCGSLIRRLEQAGRSTFYCPRCQR
jgi:formamidopyrimidine-DNA glycosylase